MTNKKNAVSKTWKVSYQDLRCMGNGSPVPFFKKVTYVVALSRREAIEKVQGTFGPPNYGKYRASVTDHPADLFWR